MNVFFPARDMSKSCCFLILYHREEVHTCSIFVVELAQALEFSDLLGSFPSMHVQMPYPTSCSHPYKFLHRYLNGSWGWSEICNILLLFVLELDWRPREGETLRIAVVCYMHLSPPAL